MDPLVHYLNHGAGRKRSPPTVPDGLVLRDQQRHCAFGSQPAGSLHDIWLARTQETQPAVRHRLVPGAQPDVADADIDPLVHYIKHGTREGRDPNPSSIPTGTWNQTPTFAVVECIRWRTTFGTAVGNGAIRDRCSTPSTIERHPEGGLGGVNPLVHFLDNGGESSDLSEIWPDYSALRGRSRFRPAPGSSPAFSLPERFIVHPGSFSPTVTVVVPNYNHASYLRQRLDCIYAQTYPNYRVLLLDDCSSDNSRDVLESIVSVT